MPDDETDVVVVARGPGGARAAVPLDALSDPHMAYWAGGTRRPLPRPTLGAFMWCDALPADAEFGHSCMHGPGPHRIKVLVFKAHNRTGVYRQLEAEAERRGEQRRMR